MKNEIENFNSESEMLDKEIKKNLEKLIYE